MVDAVVVEGSGTGHDLFLSYRHREPDRSWVRRLLVPALRVAGVSVCLDVESFEPGAFILGEMERAVLDERLHRGRREPRGSASTFCDLEVVLSKAFGTTLDRVLVVLLQDCELPPALRAAPRLDVGGDTDAVAGQIADLVRGRVP